MYCPVEEATERELLRFRLLCGDGWLRRELLWLRACRYDDAEGMAVLERAEPGLRERMQALIRSAGVDAMDDPRERRAALDRLFDEKFQGL